MAPFQKRLGAVKHAAGFTVQDLADWLGGLSRQTVWTWLSGRNSPREYRLEQVVTALTYLERELGKRRPAFPMPLSVKEGDRRAYVREVRAKYPHA